MKIIQFFFDFPIYIYEFISYNKDKDIGGGKMIGSRIKELRKKNKMTQKALADKVFVDCSAVTKWETGKAKPDFEKQQRLADIFGVSIDYLCGRSDNEQTVTSAQSLDEQLEGVDYALWGEVLGLTDEEKLDVINYARFTKMKRNGSL